MEPVADRYRILVENLPDGFAYHQMITDYDDLPLDYIFLHINGAFEEITGLASGSVIGKRVTEVYPDIKEDDFDWIGTYGRVALTGESVQFQRYFKLSGRWYDITAYSDKPGYFAVVFRDITDQKKAEQALQEEHDWAQRYLDTVETIMVSIDISGKITMINSYGQRLLGYGRDELVGKNWFTTALPQPHGQELVYPVFKQVIEGNLRGAQYFENDVVTASGRHRLIAWHNNYLNDAHGNIVGVLSAGVDITEKKQAEERLQKSEERYRLLVENANEAINIIQDGVHKFVNPKAVQLFGRPAEELLLKPVSHFIYPEDREAALERIEKRMKMESPEDKYTLRIIAGDGKVKWTEVNAVVIEWEGRPASLSLMNDITERKETEQKFADYTQELEQLYRQLDEEMDKAWQLHKRTLPKALPAAAGLSFDAHYQPAQTLGGDFYDVIEAGNKLIIYLSDVSGHGLDGAMLSVFIKHTIKSYISFTPVANITPAQILRHLAAQYRQESYPEELYICIFLAVLDRENKKLTYCGAGFQDTPLVQSGNGEKTKLSTVGMFITSYLPEDILEFQDKSLTLTPGITIFFNTDGLTEQGVNGSYYRDRLSDAFHENAHLPPDLVAHAVINDFRKFNNGSLQGKDDITFLVLQVDEAEKKTHYLELDSVFSELVRLREYLSSILGSIVEAHNFIACLNELVANAIEHGNCFDPGKAVTVVITVTDSYLKATVKDQGKGFNWEEKLDKPMELAGNQERGRGIAMTRICSEWLCYNHSGNEATLLVKRS